MHCIQLYCVHGKSPINTSELVSTGCAPFVGLCCDAHCTRGNCASHIFQSIFHFVLARSGILNKNFNHEIKFRDACTTKTIPYGARLWPSISHSELTVDWLIDWLTNLNSFVLYTWYNTKKMLFKHEKLQKSTRREAKREPCAEMEKKDTV